MLQLLHLYMTTRKAIALTTWTFVGKVMFLLFNMLCRFVTAFLPWSKSFMAAVTVCSDSGAQENTACHCFIISLFICQEVMGLDAMILFFFFEC